MTDKQRLFVEHYLGGANLNATEAAKRAGYPHPKQEGHRLKNAPEVAEAISQGLSERAMPAGEVLALLADHAKGTLADFVDVDEQGWNLNLAKAEAAGKMHLVHELAFTKYGPRLKLHDPQAALEKLGRHHKLFTEKHELTGADGKPLLPSIDELRALPPDELIRLHRETIGVLPEG